MLFLPREKGQGLVEYALILVLVAIVVIAVLFLVASAGQLIAQDKSWEDLDKDAKRAKIDETAKESLDEVLNGSDGAKELFDNSYGWAAFDNLKIAWGFSGGGGNGVAVNKKSGVHTYMKVGTVGVGLGLEAAGVDQQHAPRDHLGFLVQAVARDAGAVVHDGLAEADEAVEQRGLADVGPAHHHHDRIADQPLSPVAAGVATSG